MAHLLFRRLTVALAAPLVATPLALGMWLFTPEAGGDGGRLSHGDAAELPSAPAANSSAMRAAGGGPARWAAAGRRFLGFDPRGDGRVVEVFGELATADRIVVLVPGADTTLANYDSGHGGMAFRSPVTWARTLLTAEIPRIDRNARVAVVAWLGYDTPEGLGRATIRMDRAAAGARSLARFVAGLTAARPAAAVTVVGHSYGAAVTGLAASSLGPQVRDLVVVGAPGMGVENAAELKSTARVWAGRGERDWTRWIPPLSLFGAGHGGNPADADFGATRFSVAGADGHDRYFTADTESVRNIARIVLGRYDTVTQP